VPRLGF